MRERERESREREREREPRERWGEGGIVFEGAFIG